MDKFLNSWKPPELNQEEIVSLDRPMTYKEIEATIQNLLNEKGQGPDGFTTEFYQNLKIYN